MLLGRGDMRQALLLIIACLAICAGAGTSRSDPLQFPTPTTCPAVNGLELDPQEAQDWNACDRWTWSCISKGMEANLFAKACMEQRSPEAKDNRAKYKYAPFYNPDQYKETNGLSRRFVYTILTKPKYSAAIAATGLRIVGGYFADTVNLENVTTDKNLVFDQSIFKSGLRLTNFRGDRNVSLDGSNIRGRLFLLRANIGGTLFMEDGVFDLLDAGDARFSGSIDGPGAVFNAPIRLDRVKVEGKVSFIRARITELTAFDTTIGSKLEMRYAHVRGRIDLTGSTINGDVRFQRLQFGESLADNANLVCDWDLHDPANRFFLTPTLPEFSGQDQTYSAILNEVVFSRPDDSVPDYPCLKPKEPLKSPDVLSRKMQHEMLLRDMKIGGALCLIDLTGEIPDRTGRIGANQNLTSISLDGTEARTTILRWTPTTSDTMWQAVHFRTRNLFLDLNNPPNQYFFDNLEIGNVSFLKPVPRNLEAEEQQEDTRNFLCDVPSGPDARYASDAPETHQRVINFFNSSANKSNSAQPFGEIVKRLDSSGNASTQLKIAFGDYKFRSLCESSEFFKRMKDQNTAGWFSTTRSAYDVTRSLIAESKTGAFEEVRRIGLDVACKPMLAAYKYTVSYGYEPLNVIYIIIFFVLLFWLLLRFDHVVPTGPEGRPPRLGLLYAMDMFNPFTQVRINRAHGGWAPEARWLRAYLGFHRFMGFILCLLLALGIYGAGHGASP
jgi:hypothetical protein